LGTSICQSVTLARPTQALFQRAVFHRVPADVGQQRHEHIVVALDGCIELRVGRFDRAAVAAPKVEFPTEPKSVVPLAEPTFGRCAAIGDVHAHTVACKVAVVELSLWEKLADDDAPLGASRQHAKAGFPQCEILLVGVLHQSVDDRVVEDRPPLLDVRVVVAKSLVGRVDPILLDRSRRAAVVRADLAAVMDVLRDRRATGDEEQQRCDGEPSKRVESEEWLPGPWRPAKSSHKLPSQSRAVNRVPPALSTPRLQWLETNFPNRISSRSR
jgi:hypothetical protein